MNTTNAELFKKALSESLTEHYNSQLSMCKDEIRLSRRHKAIMKRIISGGDVGIHNRSGNKVRKRTVTAILIAAALLLTGCAYIYREEIREFFVEIFDTHYRVTSDHDEYCPETIERVYELSYVPEGYEFVKNYGDDEVFNACLWKNGDEKIYFKQMTLKAKSAINREGIEADIIERDDFIIYRIETSEYKDCFIWNDGFYILRLNSTVDLSTEELFRIIDGINIK